MSREQWGHGYWKGVNDAISGSVGKTDIERLSETMVCCMCRANQSKEFDKSLFAVSQAFTLFCRFSGINEEDFKNAYKYILNKEPLGCYVSGNPNDDMMNDFFVLPNLTDEYIQEVLSNDNR